MDMAARAPPPRLAPRHAARPGCRATPDRRRRPSADNRKSPPRFSESSRGRSAIPASSTALPTLPPATVSSAARVPCRAPVAMISVTIGPGVTIQHDGDEQEGGEELVVHWTIMPGLDPGIPLRWATSINPLSGSPRQPGDDSAYSSSSSLSRSTDTTCSSSAVLSTITPCVERPAMRMPDTGVRISLPWSVTSMI